MDFIQDYLPLLNSLLPPSLLSTLIHTSSTTFAFLHTLQTHLAPLITKLTTSPDLTSLILLLITLFLSFKVLDMAYRAVMFWVRLIFRVVLWGSIAGVGLWIYNRGIEGFVGDVEGLVSHWWGEYERFSAEVGEVKRGKERELFREQQKVGRGGSRSGWR